MAEHDWPQRSRPRPAKGPMTAQRGAVRCLVRHPQGETRLPPQSITANEARTSHIRSPARTLAAKITAGKRDEGPTASGRDAFKRDAGLIQCADARRATDPSPLIFPGSPDPLLPAPRQVVSFLGSIVPSAHDSPASRVADRPGRLSSPRAGRGARPAAFARAVGRPRLPAVPRGRSRSRPLRACDRAGCKSAYKGAAIINFLST